MPAAIPLTGPNGGLWVKVDTLTVATRTNQTAATGVQSNVVLDAGTTYLAVVSGTARIATDATGFADAEFIRYNKSTGPQDGSSPGYAWNNHGVRLAGVAGGTTTGNLWGTYQSDHQYIREVTGQGTKVTGYYSDLPGYYGDNSGTLQVDIYAEVPVVLDLDVNANSQLGDKLGDLTMDGAANYLPGYEGGTQKLFSGTFNSGTFTPQRMKIVLDGIGSDTPKIARVVFRVTSTRLPGYASNMTDPNVTGAGKENDFSFHRDIDSDVYTIDVNSRERRDEGDPEDGKKVVEGGVMEGSKTWLNFFAKDFGGAATVTAQVFTTDDANKPAQTFTLKVPADEDSDGIADKWEKAMLERWKAQYRLGADFNTTDLKFFSPGDDKEKKDPDGSGPLVDQAEEGDAHIVFEEHRGYILDGGGTDGDGGNTHAGGHVRLDPARKELLVEIDRDKKIDSLPEGGLRGVMNGSAAMFSKNQGGAGIYMYYLFDEVELALRLRDVVNAEDQVKTLGAHRDTTSARETGSPALASDFVHLLVVNNAGSLEGAWAWGRGTNPPTPLVSRGVLLAVGDLVFLHRDFLPNETFGEVLISTVTHELTHQLIDRNGAKFFTKGEHTTDPHGTGVIDDLAKSDIMYTDIEKRGNSKARFLSVVQSAIRVRSNDGLVE